jgi:spartin
VQLEISADGKRISVTPISEEYLEMARHPAYKDSGLVQTAATASRFIVTSSSSLGNILTSGADNFTQKVKPAAKPMEFSPATHERVRKINAFTNSAVGVSAKTVGQATKYAQNIGARFAGKNQERARKGFETDGKPSEQYKPGLLNRSMIAFSTIADGIATSGKNLLEQSGSAASTVVGHRYGPEAGSITSSLAGGVKNVGLVYIDVTGVSRRAVLKSVAKGMVVGRVRNGGQVIVGGGDGGVVEDEDMRRAGLKSDGQPPAYHDVGSVEGYGMHTGPSSYQSGIGESISGQPALQRDMKKYG